MVTETDEANRQFRSAFKPSFRPPSNATSAPNDAAMDGPNGFDPTSTFHAETRSLERAEEIFAVPMPLNGQTKATHAPSALRKPSGTTSVMKFDDSLELEQIFKDESEDLFFVDEQDDVLASKKIVPKDLRAQNAPSNMPKSIEEQFQALSVSTPVRGGFEPRVEGEGMDLKQAASHKKGPVSKARPASSRSSSATNGAASRQPKPDVSRARHVSDSALHPKSTPGLSNDAIHAPEPMKASSEKVRKKVKLRAADLGVTSLKSLGPEALHEAVAKWKMENGQVGVVTSITIQPVKDIKNSPNRMGQANVERHLSSNTDVNQKEKSPTRSICSAQTVKSSNNVSDKAINRSGMDIKRERRQRSLPGAHETVILSEDQTVQAPRHASLGSSNTSAYEMTYVALDENSKNTQEGAESSTKNGLIQPQHMNDQGPQTAMLDLSTSKGATAHEKTSQNSAFHPTKSAKILDKKLNDLAVSSHEEKSSMIDLPSQAIMDSLQTRVQKTDDASRSDVSAAFDVRAKSKSSTAQKGKTSQIGSSDTGEGFKMGVSQQQLGLNQRQKIKSTSERSRRRKPLRSEEHKTNSKRTDPPRKRAASSTETEKRNIFSTGSCTTVPKEPQASSREESFEPKLDGSASRKRDINHDKKENVEGRVTKKRNSLRNNSVTKTKTSSAGQNRLEKDKKASINQDTPSSHIPTELENEGDVKSGSTATRLARKSTEKWSKDHTRLRGRSEGPAARKPSEQSARTKVRSRSAAVPEKRRSGQGENPKSTAKAKGEVTHSGSQTGLSTAVLYDSHRGSFRDLMKGALRRVSSRYLSDSDNQMTAASKTEFSENAARLDEPGLDSGKIVGDNGELPESENVDDIKMKLGIAGISENQVEALRKMGLKITTV